jgi:hypothetical protein
MVSPPLVVWNRTTEYLDRIWDNFYGYIGSVLPATRNKSKATLLQCQLQRMSLSYSFDE